VSADRDGACGTTLARTRGSKAAHLLPLPQEPAAMANVMDPSTVPLGIISSPLPAKASAAGCQLSPVPR
jgi:hypothetical protein